MSKPEKLQPLLIFAAVLMGLVAAPYDTLRQFGAQAIVPALQIMLFFVFFTMPFGNLVKAFRSFKVTGSALIINFIVTPVVAYLLGVLFLADSPMFRIGLLMLLATPCTDWYLVFTGLSRGNVPLALSLLPWNLFLQLALLPVYLSVFFGEVIGIDVLSIFDSILRVLVIPFALAMIVRMALARRKDIEHVREKYFPLASPLQIIFLCLAITSMFASRGIAMLEQGDIMLRLLLPLGIFFSLTSAIVVLVSRLLKIAGNDRTSLLLTTLARNSPLALAIAASVFPHRPHIATVLVIGALLELPVLAILSNTLTRMHKKQYLFQWSGKIYKYLHK